MAASRRIVIKMSRCQFGLFEFDLSSGELRREGHVVKLPPQPTKVLTLLLERPGELVPRERLKSHIWGDDTFVDFERGLNFCILQVRGALGDASDNPRFVQTIPRKGYRFIAPVTVVEVPSPTHQPPPEPAAPNTPAVPSVEIVPHAAAPRAWRWTFAAAMLSVMIAAGVVVLQRPRDVAVAKGSVTRVRVAILPFVNLTGDSALDYLGDGLTDELITQLGLLGRDVAVIARTSAMSYRGSAKNVSQIGMELDVAYVVEGGLRRQGQGLRVASRLIRVADQTHSANWSEAFDQATSGLQLTRTATRLARLIALELVPASVSDRPTTVTADSIASDAFLEGKALKNSGSAAGIQQALVHFETAAQQDPAFAAAWAKIAETRHQLVMIGALRPGDAYAAARTAAERAVALDRNLADAHLAQGLIQLWNDWRPSDAARSFERSLALNPSLAAAHHDYAWALVALGRNDDAIRHITTARALDPLSTRATNDVGWLYLQLREPAEAARACEHTLAIGPASLDAQACLERAYAQRGSFEAALEAAKATMPPASGFRVIDGSAEAALQSIWRWRLDQLEEAAQIRWISPYTRAGLRAALGSSEKAIQDLESAYDEHDGMMVLLDRDPLMDGLRLDPRVQALIKRVNQQRSMTTAPTR